MDDLKNYFISTTCIVMSVEVSNLQIYILSVVRRKNILTTLYKCVTSFLMIFFNWKTTFICIIVHTYCYRYLLNNHHGTCYRIYLYELPPEFTVQNTTRIHYTNYCIKSTTKKYPGGLLPFAIGPFFCLFFIYNLYIFLLKLWRIFFVIIQIYIYINNNNLCFKRIIL